MSVASPSGTSEELGTISWSLLLKKSKKADRISEDFIGKSEGDEGGAL
jgi:hypothetical protein